MALNVQFVKSMNPLINEYIVTPRLVNQQLLQYDDACDYLAQGSTVTAADVSAVMKQIETALPRILSLNTKIVCSPNGLTFRPAVRGSITQSELKAKLEAKKLANPQANVDVDRELQLSDLTINDLTACIVIDLPKGWDNLFKQMVEFKRVTKVTQDSNSNGSSESDDSGSSSDSGSNSGNGDSTPTVAAPVIGGTTPFTESTSVTISGPEGAAIYYTVDGSTPTSASTAYTEAIALTDTTTVKAVAVKDGVSSAVSSKTFTKGTGGGDGENNDSE